MRDGRIRGLATVPLVAVLALGGTPAAGLAERAVAADCVPDAPYTDCLLFTATGSDQQWTVPAGVSSARVELSGAGGGPSVNSGAAGGRTTGTVAVRPGASLTVMAGSGGLPNGATAYGGGGAAGAGTRVPGGAGGGMSALWAGPSGGTPLLVAGGGGGGGGATTNPVAVTGGPGGGAEGAPGKPPQQGGGAAAGGGTQTAGGAATTNDAVNCAQAPGAGVRFAGGAGAPGMDGGGGGGGGLYGGGGGTCQIASASVNSDSAGAGGSGYVGGAGVSDAVTTPGAGAAGAAGNSARPGGDGSVRLQWGDTGDLSVTQTGPATGEVGDALAYVITVSNAGPAGVAGARVTDTLPASLTGVTWTCTASAGAACGEASGSGNAIDTTADLPPGGKVELTVTAVAGSASSGTTVTSSAAVSAPAGWTDTDAGDDRAEVATDIASIGAAPRMLWPVDDSRTQDDEELFQGDNSRPGLRIRVTDATRGELCAAVADADGLWSCSARVEVGEYELKATSPAGADDPVRMRVTAATAGQPQTRPGDAPTPVLTSPEKGDRVPSGTPRFAGVGAHPYDRVTVTVPGGGTCAALSAADGSFQCALPRPLGTGPHEASVESGGITGGSVAFRVDPGALPRPNPERHESTGTMDAWTLRRTAIPMAAETIRSVCDDAADPGPALLRFRPFPDVRLSATTRSYTREGDRVMWTGDLSGSARGLATLSVGCSGTGDLSGVLSATSKVYELRGKDGQIAVTEYDGAAFELGEPNVTVRSAGGRSPSAARRAPKMSVIDVVSVYTPKAAAAVGGDAKMEAKIDLSVAMANAATAASDVPVRVRMVAKAKAANYRGTEDAGAALGPFYNASDGIADEGPRMRDQYGADVAVLWTNEGSGVAYGPPDPGPDMAYFGYMSLNQSYVPINTFAHELGHVMGGTHDWVADPSPHNEKKLYDHAYLGPKNSWVSILGYGSSCHGCPRIPYYANADESYNGAALGLLGGKKPADTSRRFNETAAAVAAYRPEKTPSKLYELKTAADPSAAGGVTAASAGPYLGGTTVAVKATARPGYAFKGWTLDGANLPPSASLDVRMDRDHTVAARFSAGSTPRYLLSSAVTPRGGGDITVSPSVDSVGLGARVLGRATPADGYRFVGWESDGEPVSSSPSLDVKIADDTTLLARFGRPVHGLDVDSSGSGTAKVNVPGPYADGETVQITASPAPGQWVGAWEVDGVRRPGSTVLSLRMSQNTVVKAVFEAVPPADVDLSVSPPAQITAGTALVVPFDLRNKGRGPAQDISLNAVLPAWLQTSALPTGCRLSGRALSCALADLAAGTSTQVVLRGVVAPTALGVSGLSASTSWARPDRRTARGTSVTGRVSIVGRADVVLAGTVGKLARGRNGTVVYKAVNRGPSAARLVTFSGTFSTRQVTVTRVAGTGCRKSGNGFTCTRPSTAPGSTSPVTITVAVSRKAKGAFAATARIRTATPDTSAGNNVAKVPPTGRPPLLGEEPIGTELLRPRFSGLDVPGATVIVAGACTTTARRDGTWECGFSASPPVRAAVPVPRPAKKKRHPANACRAVVWKLCRPDLG